ncbi:glycoside hydrolase domain-containing protein [Halalkalibacter alkalisediminis]|uniref:Glycoside hydrolase domain-containing protein n=1 Tax=Halalkalibacter alkalisediminis TaxID=935616 RepID=A0ABV6NEV8_9BACI|nr:glycoside hydrolase domain-containing protein [Halalkalibacter alkalisediminis]
MQILNWGVDSAAAVTDDLYQCVVENLGQPDFWGRYLSTIPNVSEGLTLEEVRRIHDRGMKIMPIYNNFREAVGARAGAVAARNAIFKARQLGIPEGVFLFANVERFFVVDADWIIAWVEAMYNSPYRPGIYADPDEGPFNAAYCQASEASNLVREQAVIWSAEPEPGTTPKRRAPKRFNPSRPDCEANVWAWQYGRDAEECPIDTVLMEQRLYQTLF